MPEHELMTPQQRVQLNHVAKHLHSKFHGIFGLESVEAFVFESYDELAKTATVTTVADRLGREVRPATARSPGALTGPLREERARRALSVRAQRRALPDGVGLVQSSWPLAARLPGREVPNPDQSSTRMWSRP